MTSFVNEMEAWYNQILNTDKFIPGVWGAFPPSWTLEEFPNWFEFRGGQESVNNPNATDATGDAYQGAEFAGARIVPIDV